MAVKAPKNPYDRVHAAATPLNTTFYVAFTFQMEGNEKDYTFAMEHLKALLISLNLSDSHVIFAAGARSV